MQNLTSIISAQPQAREKRFMFLTARTRMSEPAASEAGRLTAEGLDWGFVIRHASHHGITGLIYRSLRHDFDAAQAAEGIERLEPLVKQTAIHSLRYIEEMFRIVAFMEARDVPIIPFKGPALALSVYGDASFRPFTDIDFLVERRNFHQAKELLRELGYHPHKEMDAREEEEHEESRMGYPMVKHGSGLNAELHWALINRIHSFGLEPEAVWKRHEHVQLRGISVRTFSHEDLILYLCAHHTKHMWARISWIVDIAECIRHVDRFRWEELFRRAEALRCNRMVSLGLRLAKELLDADMPREVEERVFSDRRAQSLARETVGGWLFADPGSEPVAMDAIFRYQFASREALRDRVPYALHHTKMLVQPTKADRDALTLPASMSFLYYIVRPFRLLAGLAGRPFSRAAREGG